MAFSRSSGCPSCHEHRWHIPDAKAEALLDWIYRLQAEEGDLDLKLLVFTECVPPPGRCCTSFSPSAASVVCLNGAMDMEAHKRVPDAFAKDARILISTDAGGFRHAKACPGFRGFTNPSRLDSGALLITTATSATRALNWRALLMSHVRRPSRPRSTAPHEPAWRCQHRYGGHHGKAAPGVEGDILGLVGLKIQCGR